MKNNRHAETRPELDADLGVVRRVIGSRGFLWALGAIGVAATTLVTLGAQTWIQKQAVLAPEFQATKGDVDTLKIQIKILGETADGHTYQLAENAKAQASAAAIQDKIFSAIKGIRDDVHALDSHISAVGQKVDDQADQVRELRADQRK